MATLGELTQEILKRKSQLSIQLMQLAHLEEMYLSNDAGPAELTLSHTDGGRVGADHIADFRDELLEQIDTITSEIATLEQISLPVIIPNLLSGEDPEPPEDPDDSDEEDDEEEEDDAQETLQFEDEEAEDSAESEEVDPEGDQAEEELQDEEDGDAEDEDEPSARAS